MGLTKITFLVTLVVVTFLVEDIQGCFCPPTPFRDSFCSSPFAIKGFVHYLKEGEDIIPRGMYTRYAVDIERVYRKPADDAIREGKVMIISVPNESSMCAMSLTGGRDYFITGYIYPNSRNKYQVNGCELAQFYESLTAEQIAGISGAYGCSV